MLVFGNKSLEKIISGEAKEVKPSRRIRKLKKKASKITRIF